MERKEQEVEASSERGSTDVFHDLGLADADELLAKARLARAVASAIKQRQISQSQLSRLTGIDQPKLSNLLHGKISGFSSDRLMFILLKLDQDISIVIRPKPENRPASMTVDYA